VKALVLAGGSGTRLWPLSRKNYPKQFLKLNSDKSLLQQTVERLLKVYSPEDIVVMTNNKYKFHVLSDMNALSESKHLPPVSNMILEPAGRNTAPAIALGMKYCLEKLGCKEDEVLFICPSDHIIRPIDKFAGYIRLSEEIAQKGQIVTFGIKPTRPETGYGYIKAGKPASLQAAKHVSVQAGKLAGSQAGKRASKQAGRPDGGYFKVEKFAEKPDIKTAQEYVNEGNYFWNSGMFAFSIGTMMKEFGKHAPGIKKMLDMSFDDLVSNFKGNVRMGDTISIDTKDTLVISSKRLISTIGIEDCLIIDTDDAVLVARKGETQKVREIVNKLKADNRKEALEHLTTYRPWGSYTVLEESERYKIKRIVVNPGERLSLQMHYHRSEHWVVVRGAAKVTIGDKDVHIHENESAYVPKSTLHRLENPGKVPLEIIEVQNGEYVGEDDIVRLDDVYGRTKK
jgi:mannose-1-phosphate guanylyltransferase/mannose-6-phosphate isomerase